MAEGFGRGTRRIAAAFTRGGRRAAANSEAADSAGGTLGRVLSHVSVTEHFDSFARGVIDTKDVIYYLNLIILSLFLTLRSLESKRWRG